jgi:hypothetical protein
MAVGVGSTRQPIPEIVPHRGPTASCADEDWQDQHQSNPSRSSTRASPPHQKSHHRQGGETGHQPRERKAHRDRENAECAAEEAKPHQHVRARPVRSAADRRSCCNAEDDRNEGAREGRSKHGASAISDVLPDHTADYSFGRMGRKQVGAAVDDESSQDNEKQNCGGDWPRVIFGAPWIGPPAVVAARILISVFKAWVGHVRTRV